MIYPELEVELVIGGVYVRVFLKEPTFDLPEPLNFLEALMGKWLADMQTQLGVGRKAGVSMQRVLPYVPH